VRFLFYDRIVRLEKGRFIEGIKVFSLSEEFLRKHFDKAPMVPGGIYLEAMGQLLGWLVNYTHDFRRSAILSLLEDAWWIPGLRPGFQAVVRGELLSSSSSDSLGRARMEVDGKPVASVGRILYRHFPVEDPSRLERWFAYYGGTIPPRNGKVAS